MDSKHMRKVIAAINVSLDGFCDHTVGIADEELHQHYTDLLNNADTLLYGRITYKLMESYWPTLVKSPSGNKEIDEFALAIDKITKIVFSRTLKSIEWESAKLANRDLEEVVIELRKQSGKDILVGSPSLIVALTKLGIIDEYQLCVHPVIAGNGLPLFKDVNAKITLKLKKTKPVGSGAITLYYEPYS